MAGAVMRNKAKVIARLKKLPAVVKAAVAARLKIEAVDLVDSMQRAAPVSDDLEGTPGEFRDSIHEFEVPGMEQLSRRILADAKDPQGRFIGHWIEFGHSHATGTPSFFPIYRARRKAMKRRLSAAARKAIRSLFPKVTP